MQLHHDIATANDRFFKTDLIWVV